MSEVIRRIDMTIAGLHFLRERHIPEDQPFYCGGETLGENSDCFFLSNLVLRDGQVLQQGGYSTFLTNGYEHLPDRPASLPPGWSINIPWFLSVRQSWRISNS